MRKGVIFFYRVLEKLDIHMQKISLDTGPTYTFHKN